MNKIEDIKYKIEGKHSLNIIIYLTLRKKYTKNYYK